MSPKDFSSLVENKTQTFIVPYFDEMCEEDERLDGLDPLHLAHEADEVFRDAGLRTMRGRSIGLLAFQMGEGWARPVVVGCTMHEVRTYREEMGEVPEGEEAPYVYEFDLAVHPDAHGGLIGFQLAKASIQEAKSNECGLMWNWVINPTMAKLLEHLGFEYAGSPEEKEGYSAHMYLWL